MLLLSLKGATKKRSEACQHLETLGLKYHWIEGIDGSALSNDAINQCYDKVGGLKFYSTPLSRGEIGCYLSHLKCYEFMKRHKIASAVIMEDDARPKLEFIKLLKLKDQFPTDCSIVHFCPSHDGIKGESFQMENQFHCQALCDDFYLSKYYIRSAATNIYFITLEYAMQLQSYLMPIRIPIDVVLFDMTFSLRYAYAIYKKNKNNNKYYQDIAQYKEYEQDIQQMDIHNHRQNRSPVSQFQKIKSQFIQPKQYDNQEQINSNSQSSRQKFAIKITAALQLIYLLLKSLRTIVIKIEYLLQKLLCYFPWSDKYKINYILGKHYPNIMQRNWILLRSIDWKLWYQRYFLSRRP